MYVRVLMVSSTALMTSSEKLEDGGSQQITKQEAWLHLRKQLPCLLGTVPFTFFSGTKGKCALHMGKFFFCFFCFFTMIKLAAISKAMGTFILIISNVLTLSSYENLTVEQS